MLSTNHHFWILCEVMYELNLFLTAVLRKKYIPKEYSEMVYRKHSLLL